MLNMINETCNFLINNSTFSCIKLAFEKSILNYFHIYVGMFLVLILFFANLFGNKIGKNKQERTFYGLIIFFIIIPIFIYSQIYNFILLFIGIIIFIIIYYHFLNYTNILNYIETQNKFNNFILTYSFKWKFLLFLYIWILFNIYYSLTYSSDLYKLIMFTIAYVSYLLVLILILIDLFLSFTIINKPTSGIIKYASGKKIYFDYLLDGDNDFIKIVKENQLIKINKTNISEIIYDKEKE